MDSQREALPRQWRPPLHAGSEADDVDTPCRLGDRSLQRPVVMGPVLRRLRERFHAFGVRQERGKPRAREPRRLTPWTRRCGAPRRGS